MSNPVYNALYAEIQSWSERLPIAAHRARVGLEELIYRVWCITNDFFRYIGSALTGRDTFYTEDIIDGMRYIRLQEWMPEEDSIGKIKPFGSMILTPAKTKITPHDPVLKQLNDNLVAVTRDIVAVQWETTLKQKMSEVVQELTLDWVKDNWDKLFNLVKDRWPKITDPADTPLVLSAYKYLLIAAFSHEEVKAILAKQLNGRTSPKVDTLYHQLTSYNTLITPCRNLGDDFFLELTKAFVGALIKKPESLEKIRQAIRAPIDRLLANHLMQNGRSEKNPLIDKLVAIIGENLFFEVVSSLQKGNFRALIDRAIIIADKEVNRLITNGAIDHPLLLKCRAKPEEKEKLWTDFVESLLEKVGNRLFTEDFISGLSDSIYSERRNIYATVAKESPLHHLLEALLGGTREEVVNRITPLVTYLVKNIPKWTAPKLYKPLSEGLLEPKSLKSKLIHKVIPPVIRALRVKVCQQVLLKNIKSTASLIFLNQKEELEKQILEVCPGYVQEAKLAVSKLNPSNPCFSAEETEEAINKQLSNTIKDSSDAPYGDLCYNLIFNVGKLSAMVQGLDFVGSSFGYSFIKQPMHKVVVESLYDYRKEEAYKTIAADLSYGIVSLKGDGARQLFLGPSAPLVEVEVSKDLEERTKELGTVLMELILAKVTTTVQQTTVKALFGGKGEQLAKTIQDIVDKLFTEHDRNLNLGLHLTDEIVKLLV